MQSVPRAVVMGIEDALVAGARRAYGAARGMDEGHLPHVVGQLRHFHMNEAFQRALAANGAAPAPIRGNGIVTGHTGVFTLARFNIPVGVWINGRRSHTRRQMALANQAIEPLVQPELFSGYQPPSAAVAFFVACFSGKLHLQPEAPISIQLAVPDRHLRGWLFREPLDVFLRRYHPTPVGQHDLAVPTLKQPLGQQRHQNGTAR